MSFKPEKDSEFALHLVPFMKIEAKFKTYGSSELLKGTAEPG